MHNLQLPNATPARTECLIQAWHRVYLAKQTKSELCDLLPLLNSGRIVLPRNDCLQGQIVGLERRTSAVGRDTISHPDRGHDDVANAVAGAAALSKFGGYDTSLRWVSGDDDDWTAKTQVGFL